MQNTAWRLSLNLSLRNLVPFGTLLNEKSCASCAMNSRREYDIIEGGPTKGPSTKEPTNIYVRIDRLAIILFLHLTIETTSHSKELSQYLDHITMICGMCFCNASLQAVSMDMLLFLSTNAHGPTICWSIYLCLRPFAKLQPWFFYSMYLLGDLAFELIPAIPTYHFEITI